MTMSTEETPARQGTEHVLEITDLAFGGRGVARLSGLVVFVEGALPGESVRARIRRTRRGFAEASLIEILRRSSLRTTPPCRHYAECGGCDLQHLDPRAQARAKGEQVRALLCRIARLVDPPVRETVVVDGPLSYRFRMDFDWRRDRRGRASLGLHRRARPREILAIQQCELTSRDVNAMVTWLAREAGARRLTAWDPHRRTGLLRRVSTLEAHGTGEMLVGLDTGRGDPPALTEMAVDLVRRFPRVVGVARRAFDRRGSVADSILTGRDFLNETVEGDRFRVPIQAFFQPHRQGAPTLRREVVAAVDPQAGDVILELYCGVGLFTLALARRAREVVGVEGARETCAAARANASEAGAANCRFLSREVGEALPDLLTTAWDAVLLDPPRGGVTRDVALALAASPSARLIYVSCDPATLARDLGILTGTGGYRLDAVVPVDLFPQTHHVECVARLTRS